MSEGADTGLSNERTALAWQRTALSVLVGSLAMARVTFSRLGDLALVVVAVAVVLSAWVFVESRWRYAQKQGSRERDRARGGRGPAMLAVAVIVLGLLEGAALVVSG